MIKNDLRVVFVLYSNTEETILSISSYHRHSGGGILYSSRIIYCQSPHCATANVIGGIGPTEVRLHMVKGGTIQKIKDAYDPLNPDIDCSKGSKYIFYFL